MTDYPKINSNAYWDWRFRQDWQEKSGPSQSRFFARLAIDHLPAWLFYEIRRRQLSVVDWGCAQGDGTDLLTGFIDSSLLLGVDFSAVAIEQAASRYPTIRFLQEDWLAGDAPATAPYDVVFSSNTLEHFHCPYDVLERLTRRARKAVVLAIPYQELERHEEHFFTFMPGNIPVELANGFRLVWSQVVNCGHVLNPLWGGHQIFLIYAANDWLAELRLTLADCRLEQNDNQSEIDALNDNLRNESASVSALRGERDDLSARLEATKLEAAGLRDDLSARLAELEATKPELEATKLEVAGLSNRLAQSERALQSETAARNTQAVKLAAIDRVRNNWEIRARALENSTSWRLTRPLRIMSESVRPIRDGFRRMVRTHLSAGTGLWFSRRPAEGASGHPLNSGSQVHRPGAPKKWVRSDHGKTIGFYIYSLDTIGGLELWATDMASEFRRQGHDPVLIVYDRMPTNDSGLNVVRRFPGRIVFLDQEGASLAAEAKKLSLDAVIVNHVYEGIATIDPDIFVVEVLHNLYFWQKGNKTIQAERRRIDHYVAVSRPVMEYAEQLLRLPADRIDMYPHALSKDGFYRPYRSFLARRRNSPEFRILCVANYLPQKNLVCLIEAFGRLEAGKATLILVGEPVDQTYVQAMEEASARHGIQNKVILTGALGRRELSRQYAVANLFVLPSLYEGFGLVVLEALYFGLPIVVANTGYADNFMDEARANGIMVPIAQKLDRLTDEDIKRESYMPMESSINALREAMKQIMDNYHPYLEAAMEAADRTPDLDNKTVAKRYVALIQSKVAVTQHGTVD